MRLRNKGPFPPYWRGFLANESTAYIPQPITRDHSVRVCSHAITLVDVSTVVNSYIIFALFHGFSKLLIDKKWYRQPEAYCFSQESKEARKLAGLRCKWWKEIGVMGMCLQVLTEEEGRSGLHSFPSRYCDKVNVSDIDNFCCCLLEMKWLSGAK